MQESISNQGTNELPGKPKNIMSLKISRGTSSTKIHFETMTLPLESNLSMESYYLKKIQMIPQQAFQEIQKELERLPIAMNKYRLKSGHGRSQAFGVVNRRCLPVDYSRNCWMRPYLYKLLLDFGQQYVDISFNAITVNQNYAAAPHRDKQNCGESFLVAFGDYTGGELEILEGELKGKYNICRTPIKTDFSKVLHQVLPFQGNRYSLVYYKLETKEELPPPSVRMYCGRWNFYRGEELINRKIGLPHPLKNRTKVDAKGV